MTIANETLGKLIKDITSLCDNCTYDVFIKRSKNIKETIFDLKSLTLHEMGLEDSKRLFQKEIYDKIDFPKVERIGKTGRITSIVGVCVMELLWLILSIIGVNGDFCTVMAILSVFLFGGAYLGITFWEVKRLAVRNLYNGLKKVSENTKNTVEILDSLNGTFEYIYKNAVNKPEAFPTEVKPKKSRSKKN